MNRRDFLIRNTTAAFGVLLYGGTVEALEALLPEELPTVLPARDRLPSGAPRALYLRSFEAWGVGTYAEPTRVSVIRAAAHYSMTFAQGAIPPLYSLIIGPDGGHASLVLPPGQEIAFINDDYPLVLADPWIEWETSMTELGDWPRMVEIQGWRSQQPYATRFLMPEPQLEHSSAYSEEWEHD